MAAKDRFNLMGFKVSRGLLDTIARAETINQRFREAIERDLAARADAELMGRTKRQVGESIPFEVQQRREIADSGSLTDLFCPHCGILGLNVEAGDGDFYVGPTYWCRAGCDRLFTMG